jgi:dTDP-4-dehydrorhamnose reductase
VKQKILITGGSGLLALNWAHAVSNRCSVTLGLHNRHIVFPEVQTQQIDLESVDKLVRSITETAPHVVIHTAGLTSVDRCESEPEFAHHVNVTLAANIAKAAAISRVGLVHISTDHLFSGQDELVDETTQPAPVNVYGQTKAEAELRVLDANPQSLVIRTNFYGWGTSYRQSFSDNVINALRAGSGLTLYQDVFYTPIIAETLALTVHDLVDLGAIGIFNVVGDDRTSKFDFGFKLSEEFGLDFGGVKAGRLSDQTNLVHRPRDMSLSNQKVCNLLGRRLGDTKAHLVKLHQQEINGFAQEMRAL